MGVGVTPRRDKNAHVSQPEKMWVGLIHKYASQYRVGKKEKKKKEKRIEERRKEMNKE